MTENNNEYPDIEFMVVGQKPRPWWKKSGCLLGLFAWLALMMIPFFMLLLAFQGEITINHWGDVPSRFEHPFLQVVLIMEPREQGLRFTRSTVNKLDENRICMETHIRFWMWQGQPQDALSYCKCYSRQDKSDGWGSGTIIDGDDRCLTDG
jgi:hypothetical protein